MFRQWSRLVLLLASALVLVVADQTSYASEGPVTQITVRAVLDVDESNSYEPGTDQILNNVEMILWQDLNANQQLDYPGSEPFWTQQPGPGPGEFSFQVEVTSGNDSMCALAGFGARIPESFEPYERTADAFCAELEVAEGSGINVLFREWDGIVRVLSWFDSDADREIEHQKESFVGPQAFDLWIDRDHDGKLSTETPVTSATRGTPEDAGDGGVFPVGDRIVVIDGSRTGDVVCIRATEPPPGYRVSSVAAVLPFGSLSHCHVLVTSGLDEIWPGRAAAAFYIGEDSAPVALPAPTEPSALPRTGGGP